MTYDGVIGNQGGLPWPHNKADMGFFKSETIGKTVIMGSQTYKSIGSPLRNRVNVVLSKQTQIHISSLDEIHIYKDIDLAIRTYWSNNLYVIGGASVFKYVIADSIYDISEIIVTWFNGRYDGDTYFPVSKAQIDDNAEEETVEYFDDDITIVRYKLKSGFRFSV